MITKTLFLLSVPIVSAVLFWRNRFKLINQHLCLVVIGAVSMALVYILDAAPQGGFQHHGNTLGGYLLITLGPIGVLAVPIWAINILSRTERWEARLWIYLTVIPAVYWLGLVFFIFLSLNLGIAVM